MDTPTAPRVTERQIDDLMADITYHSLNVPGTTTTVCAAIDGYGFTLAVGMSACVSPENYDADVGERLAREDAQRKAREALWTIQGYILKHDILDGSDSNV